MALKIFWINAWLIWQFIPFLLAVTDSIQMSSSLKAEMIDGKLHVMYGDMITGN